ncbi:MAG: hypothetical protein BWX86_02875 [Verrucomicrobia bacterium ADurb.Bin122]|nr:MAG: hypothetical protein BWX86_02875 [Verrucomicrobia bacterium ADurb.Bin122]
MPLAASTPRLFQKPSDLPVSSSRKASSNAAISMICALSVALDFAAS